MFGDYGMLVEHGDWLFGTEILGKLSDPLGELKHSQDPLAVWH